MNDGQSDAALEQYKVIADANPEDAQPTSASPKSTAGKASMIWHSRV